MVPEPLPSPHAYNMEAGRRWFPVLRATLDAAPEFRPRRSAVDEPRGDHHVGVRVAGMNEAGRLYCAECICGWRSPGVADDQAAIAAADEHALATTPRAT